MPNNALDLPADFDTYNNNNTSSETSSTPISNQQPNSNNNNNTSSSSNNNNNNHNIINRATTHSTNSNSNGSTTPGLGSAAGGSGSAGGGSAAGNGGGGPSKRHHRHHNYSKNIYIGTKNAEKWELMRTKLVYKNDVEFVSYLLSLAEADFAKNGICATNGTSSASASSHFPIHLEQNLNASKLLDDNGDIKKSKSKRVQFQSDTLNGFNFVGKKDFPGFSSLSQSSQDAQDHSVSSTLEPTSATQLPEVLDCRIAEKIRSELEQKMNETRRTGDEDDDDDDDSEDEDENGVLCLKKQNEDLDVVKDAQSVVKKKRRRLKLNKRGVVDEERVRRKSRKNKHDIRRAPTDRNTTRKLEEDFAESAVVSHDVLDDDRDLSDPDEDDDDVEEDEKRFMQSDIEEQERMLDDEVEDDEEEEDLPQENANNCRYCSVEHLNEECPIRNATLRMIDSIDLETWRLKNQELIEKTIKKEEKEEDEDDEDDEDDRLGSDNGDGDEDDDDDFSEVASIKASSTSNLTLTFSEASLPSQFHLKKINAQALGVFAAETIPLHTRLGPLIGQAIQEMDIADDCNMRYIYETFNGTKSSFVSVENKNTSNWLRYVRPASSKDQRNVALVISYPPPLNIEGSEEKLVIPEPLVNFVTCTEITEGTEILYWSDECNTAWGKKKSDKLSCGGCNLKFDHSLYYRTHCSVFHDSGFSLTIRKYHCKICGMAVLGKENIMKHAAQMHDGKGAYQCQYCKKFFLRLNYLEMHRTYGCSANPQRARPLCDFCGRKFCQPQKLKVHIKRMHSDMAEVLRDFQCKLCSKLLGSRAALQRHSKEVHSRNSTVVSCPRCQKLFQNRSNLKIHMLTHSGVRPFKCAEGDCSAAFTTKQCLQFHYKKVHNYTPEQMPKIERSVAYTFDAYSGGMKVDFLEQAPRRRRKSLDDGVSMFSSSGMLDSKSETDFSDNETATFIDGYKKSSVAAKSISDLCKNEPNLSLLSSKITSLLEQQQQGMKPITGKKRGRKSKKMLEALSLQQQQAPVSLMSQHQPQNTPLGPPLPPSIQSHTTSSLGQPGIMEQKTSEDEFLCQLKQRQQSKQLSLIESFLSKSMPKEHHMQDGMDPDMAGGNHDLDFDKFSSTLHTAQQRVRDLSMTSSASCQNLVPSKGSKKWLSDNEDRRDLLTRLMIQNNNNHQANSIGGHLEEDDVDDEDDDEHEVGHSSNLNNANHDDDNSTYLDVVDHHQHHTPSLHRQSLYHQSHQMSVENGSDQLPHLASLQQHLHTSQSFMGPFYNNNGSNSARGPGNGTPLSNNGVHSMSGAGNPTATPSSSASMLVEAALSSVGNMMSAGSNHNNGTEDDDDDVDDDDVDDAKTENANEAQQTNMNNSGNSAFDHDMISHHQDHTQHPHQQDTRFAAQLSNLENEIKMMKQLNNFPMQMQPLQLFPGNASNTGGGGSSTSNTSNISNQMSTARAQMSPATNASNANLNDNEIDVDSASTPRTMDPADKLYQESEFGGQHQTPPTPQVISPGRDYGLFNNPNNNNNAATSSPMHTMHRYQNNDHELISPAVSPAASIGRRYDFADELCRKRSHHSHNHPQHHHQQQSIGGGSDDDENSIMAQNLTMTGGGGSGQMEMLYNNNASASNPATGGDGDTMQGVDMSSRSNLGFHNNFQLPSSSHGLGRYHHHIYDILSEREQQQQQQQEHMQQQQQMLFQEQMSQQQTQQQHQQSQDHDQSVDLSRSASYAAAAVAAVAAAGSPPLSYTSSHSDMLRMSSLDLPPNTMMGGNRTFLPPPPSQLPTHGGRESLEHHRFLSGEQQLPNHRLLVDPAAHLLMEQNNRLLTASESASNRHMVSPRGFGAYHHQVGSGNYHPTSVRPVLTSPPNPHHHHHPHHSANPSNYHPFATYY